MRRDIFEKFCKKVIPNEKFTIVDYQIVEKNKFEEGEWIPDRPAIFVYIHYDEFDNKELYLTEYLTKLTDFEFIITRA